MDEAPVAALASPPRRSAVQPRATTSGAQFPAPSPPQCDSDPLSPVRIVPYRSPSPTRAPYGCHPASFLAHAPRVGAGTSSLSSQNEARSRSSAVSSEDDIEKAEVGSMRLRRFLYLFSLLAFVVLVVTGALQLRALKVG